MPTTKLLRPSRSLTSILAASSATSNLFCLVASSGIENDVTEDRVSQVKGVDMMMIWHGQEVTVPTSQIHFWDVTFKEGRIELRKPPKVAGY